MLLVLINVDKYSYILIVRQQIKTHIGEPPYPNLKLEHLLWIRIINTPSCTANTGNKTTTIWIHKCMWVDPVNSAGETDDGVALRWVMAVFTWAGKI